MRRRHFALVIIALTAVGSAAIADDEKASRRSAKAQRMTFRNNTSSGFITVHKLEWRSTRTAPRDNYIETMRSLQTARWVQANLANEDVNTTTTYQMMEVFPAAVIGLSRGSEVMGVLPLPSAFNLDAGGTYLHSTTRTPKISPFKPPSVKPALEAVMGGLLDVAHWGKRRIEPGHRWTRQLESPWFRGSLRFEYQGLEELDSGTSALVTYYLDGRFEGPLHATHKFVKGQGAFLWNKNKRCLQQLDARAEYQRIRPTGNEKFEVRISAELYALATLSSDQTELMRQQLTVFSDALSALRRDNIDRCRALTRGYREQWPESVWAPAINELQIQAAEQLESAPTLSLAQVSKRLTDLIVAWAGSMRSRDYDEQDRVRAAYLELLAQYRPHVLKLSQDDNSKTRAKSMFALGFSPDPADFRLLQRSTRDKSSRVRGMTYAALAARRDPRTSAEVLLEGLNDSSGGVRARACEAIGACIVRENLAVDALVKKLLQLVRDDEKANVRRAAAEAVGLIGVPADVPPLEAALEKETEERNRAVLRVVIEKLKAYDGR